MSGKSIKGWFAGLSPDRKRKLVIGGGLLVLLVLVLVAVVATEDGTRPQRTQKKSKLEASILTGRDPQRVGIDQLLATTKRQESKIENLERQLQSMSNNGQRGSGSGGQGSMPFPYAQGNGAGGTQEVVALPGAQQDPAAARAAGVAAPKAPDKIVQQALSTEPGSIGPNGKPLPGGQRNGAQGLPPPNIPGVTDNSDVYGAQGGGAAAAPEAPQAQPKLKLRVLTPRQEGAAGAADGATSQNAVFTQPGQGGGRSLAALGRGGSANREPEFYLPMGSILSGTLMTGVDAPATGSAGKRDPFPALFRVKHEAVLPNLGLFDLRECFIVASAFGDLSSERVYMRAEGLSCQRSDGAIIEASLDAYASGGDGKAGVRGVVVEKTGQLISRSLLAGFVGGMAKAFQPQQAQQLSVNGQPGSSISFQYPSADYVIGNSLLGGASSAAGRIASIYEDLARQVVPVIEVNAGIPIDFILTRGTTLRFKRVGEMTSRPTTQPVAQGQGQGGGQRGGAMADGPVTTSVSGSLGGPFSVTPGAGSSTPARPPTGSGQTITSPTTNQMR